MVIAHIFCFRSYRVSLCRIRAIFLKKNSFFIFKFYFEIFLKIIFEFTINLTVVEFQIKSPESEKIKCNIFSYCINDPIQ